MSSSLIIEELAGRQRRLTLVGPGLPLRGAAWSGEQRLVTQFYSGNTEATQQVLGPVDLPSDWNGVWNTTRLLGMPQLLEEAGATTQIGRAFTLYQQFEDLIRAGALLRVTWVAGESLKIMREGRIGTHSFKPDRADDIAWQAQFVWIGRGGDGAKVAPRDDSVEVAVRAMHQSLTDLQSLLSAASLQNSVFSLFDAPARAMQEITTQVSSITSRVSSAVSALEQVRALPDRFADEATVAAKDTRDVMAGIATRLGRLPTESFAPAGVGVGASLRDVKLANDSHRAAVASEGQALTVESAARRAQANPQLGRRANESGPNDATAIHIVRAEETFATIARRYYGDAALGGEIAKANRFPRYAVSPVVGSRLLIPARVRGSQA
jgi:hypothetical protein